MSVSFAVGLKFWACQDAGAGALFICALLLSTPLFICFRWFFWNNNSMVINQQSILFDIYIPVVVLVVLLNLPSFWWQSNYMFVNSVSDQWKCVKTKTISPRYLPATYQPSHLTNNSLKCPFRKEIGNVVIHACRVTSKNTDNLFV